MAILMNLLSGSKPRTGNRARLETGLSRCGDETNTLKDMISSAAKKIKFVPRNRSKPARRCYRERGIANLAGRLDRAGDGCARLLRLSMQLTAYRFNSRNAPDSEQPVQCGRGWAAGGLDEKPRASMAMIRNNFCARSRNCEPSRDTWQRANLALTEIQQSIEQIAKATRGGRACTTPGLSLHL